MKKLRYLVLTLFLFILSINNVSASNKIYSIDVTAKLNTDGSALITEIWDVSTDSGTELFKPMSNLKNSSISNFQVSMNDTLYTTANTWNIKGTFDSKKYKSGINYIDNGLELCFGITSYGRRTYKLTYNVTNMINSVSDADILYWKFINDSMDPAPSKISVTVSGPTIYEDTLDVWGYGYKGYAYVADGVISMSSEENTTFGYDNYAVLLVKYPKGIFTTTNNGYSYTTFDEYYSLAEKGSFDYDYSEDTLFNIVNAVAAIAGMLGFILLIIHFATKSSPIKVYVKRKIDKNTLNYFRDIPCNKDVIRANALSLMYNIHSTRENILGALMLLWIKENKISIIKSENKVLFIKKSTISLKFDKNATFINKVEKDVFDKLLVISKDGILEENEFTNYCKNNYTSVLTWFNKIFDSEISKLIEEKEITTEKKGGLFYKLNHNLSEKLHEEAKELLGLKKFLKDFSLIANKEPLQVHVWEYYLIYAQMFGIADKVAKDFKKLYPELINNNNYSYDLTTLAMINHFSYSGIQAATTARSKAQAYSSGGGGFSSGGGGGGSSGGGSGGGSR